ncbi:unnamed protein product [Nesidiocoris tenuis]|uniref:Glutaredoxin domain-containing protein n=1 Tax=Nesidiocoris tenuis TaxID=355587 RepID=A0A6H5G6Q2_9HEMI|nr:unnamed protein product [Nesidiocoris tenuis]
MEAYALLRRLFQSYQVVMISFTYCKFCKSLAQRFESHGIPFYKLEADLLPNMKEFMDTAENLSGIRTAPQIYVNGQFVGDSSTTTKLLESGEFQKMIWCERTPTYFVLPFKGIEWRYQIIFRRSHLLIPHIFSWMMRRCCEPRENYPKLANIKIKVTRTSNGHECVEINRYSRYPVQRPHRSFSLSLGYECLKGPSIIVSRLIDFCAPVIPIGHMAGDGDPVCGWQLIVTCAADSHLGCTLYFLMQLFVRQRQPWSVNCWRMLLIVHQHYFPTVQFQAYEVNVTKVRYKWVGMNEIRGLRNSRRVWSF